MLADDKRLQKIFRQLVARGSAGAVDVEALTFCTAENRSDARCLSLPFLWASQSPSVCFSDLPTGSGRRDHPLKAYPNPIPGRFRTTEIRVAF